MILTYLPFSRAGELSAEVDPYIAGHMPGHRHRLVPDKGSFTRNPSRFPISTGSNSSQRAVPVERISRYISTNCLVVDSPDESWFWLSASAGVD